MRDPSQDQQVNNNQPEQQQPFAAPQADASNSDDIFSGSASLPQPTGQAYPLDQNISPVEESGIRYFNDLRSSIINIPRLKEEEIGLFQGKDAENRAKTIDDANSKMLQNHINELPTDQKNWMDTTAPDALAFMTDPEMVGPSALAEFGIKKVLPEATEAMTALGRFGLTVGKATAATTAAGAVINGANQLINVGTPQEMSLPHYITNTLEWSGFGLGEGVFRGLLPTVKPFVKNAINNIKNKDVIADLDQTLAPNVSRETLANAVDTNVVKVASGKVADSTTSVEAAYNQAKDDFSNARDQYNNLSEEEQANTLSPDETYQASIKAHEDAKTNSLNNISGIIKQINEDYSTPESLQNGFAKASLPSLIRAQSSLKMADSLTEGGNVEATNLLNSINDALPSAGPARKIKQLVNLPLIAPKDQAYLDNLEDPAFNLNELNKVSEDLSDNNKTLINARKKGLQKVMDQGTPEPINDHLSNLHKEVNNLDAIDTDLRQVKASYELRQQPKTDLASSAVKDAQDLSDPNKSIAGLQNVGDQEPLPRHQTYDEIDNKIDALHKSGIVSDEEMKDIANIDSYNNHEGQKKVLQRLASCILGGGSL